MTGPAIPDTDPPLIVITAPVNGTTFSSGDGFTVIADIIDESPVLEAELYVNGELFLLDNLEPWGWP
ncbi:MAG: Ig-like domain-containing protein, partial [Myxococcota bacterium]